MLVAAGVFDTLLDGLAVAVAVGEPGGEDAAERRAVTQHVDVAIVGSADVILMV